MEFPRVHVSFAPSERRNDVCVTCGPGPAAEPFRSVSGCLLVRCSRCGLVSLSGAAGLGVTVSETNEPFFSSSGFNEWFLSHEATFRRRYRRDLDQLAKFAPTGRLLDVGCGPGLFLDEARSRGWQVRGVEASPVPAAIARDRFGLPVSLAVLEEADLPEASFDVVTFFDVLEHLPSPRPVLEHAVRLLKPGGVVVAQSPNLKSLMARLSGEHWRWYFLPQHLHHFTPTTLETLLRASGLTPVRTFTWDVAEEFAANLHDRFPALRGRSRAAAQFRRMVRVGVSLGMHLWGPAGLGGLVRTYARKAAIP